jgi:spore germination protein
MSRRTALVIVALLAELLGLAGCASQQPEGEDTTQVVGTPPTLQAIAGYTVPEDRRGVSTIGNDVLTEISPVWYQPTESGQLVFATDEAEQSISAIEAEAVSHHVAVVPSISNFRGERWDAALIHRIISNPQLRQAHITAIVGLITSQGWSGIDIDYESLAARDRAAYSAFIHDLAVALHQARRRLTITVHAKVAEPGDWSGARAQDWRALGASADEVRVMAYDYSTEDSPPGAIAPLPWVEKVLQLAVSEVPRDKIMLGVPTYGYDWASGQQAQDLQWTDVQALIQAHGVAVTWDQKSQTPWFTYVDKQGHPHTVWYEDARSMQAKIDLAVRDRVHGIVIWRLGGEDPAIWKQLRQTT